MKFTQEEFDKLPALLTRAVVMQWTGLGKKELSEAARAGEIRTHPSYGGKKNKCKYFKTDVAKTCGMKN